MVYIAHVTPDWKIREPADYDERRELIALFQQYIPGTADDAVPKPQNDHLWNPVILVAIVEGKIVGGLLSCRAPVSADMVIAYGPGVKHPYVTNADRLSMLDLLAVDEDHRGRGIASALVDRARSTLIDNGVQIWFGNTGTDLDADRLTNFYHRHSFNVIPHPGQLPPFFGTDWDPTALAVDIWFWTRLPA